MDVLRQETEADRTGRTGMGLRFLEFFRQTEVTLARLFLGEQLRKFAEGYLASARARSLSSELDRVVDALAAWELLEGHLAQRPLAVRQVARPSRPGELLEALLERGSWAPRRRSARRPSRP